mgnify:CR=1 FL=1
MAEYEKRIVWVCPSCKGEMGYVDEPGECPMQDCKRALIEHHRWVCTDCGESYPGNRGAPELCEECGR